jgi:ADP-heptose:LPS heptosyltransferase
MHLAAAVGTAVITLFGPTHPRVYLPPGGRALAAEVPCPHRYTDRFGPPPCVADGRCRIGLRSCVDGIATEAVTAMLEATTGGPAYDRM